MIHILLGNYIGDSFYVLAHRLRRNGFGNEGRQHIIANQSQMCHNVELFFRHTILLLR